MALFAVPQKSSFRSFQRPRRKRSPEDMKELLSLQLYSSPGAILQTNTVISHQCKKNRRLLQLSGSPSFPKNFESLWQRKLCKGLRLWKRNICKLDSTCKCSHSYKQNRVSSEFFWICMNEYALWDSNTGHWHCKWIWIRLNCKVMPQKGRHLISASKQNTEFSLKCEFRCYHLIKSISNISSMMISYTHINKYLQINV